MRIFHPIEAGVEAAGAPAVPSDPEFANVYPLALQGK